MNGWDVIRVKVDGMYNSSAYNPDTCGDGGGYPQGTVSVTFRNSYVLEIRNMSCGEFGFRFYAGLSAREGKPFQFEAFWSNMEGMWDESYSTFPERLRGVLEHVGFLTGYRIPTKREIRDDCWASLSKCLNTVRLTRFGAEWWDGDEQFPGWCAREE